MQNTSRPLSWGWKISEQNSDATNAREYDQMYVESEKVNVDRGPLAQPSEYFFVVITYPVKRLTLRLALPARIRSKPCLQHFMPENLDRAFRPIQDGKLLHNLPRGMQWEMDRNGEDNNPVQNGKHWSLSIDYPTLFTGYSLLWALPENRTRKSTLERTAHRLRIELCQVAKTCADQQPSAVYRAIQDAVVALFNKFEGEYRGDPYKRFDVSFMTFDDECKRLVIVYGVRDKKPFPELYKAFRLPIGMGTAGVCYKTGKPIIYRKPEPYEKGPVSYVSGGEVDHGVLLSLPIDHPNYRTITRGSPRAAAERRWQLVGVLNIGCEDPGSPLSDLHETKHREKLQALQDVCQGAFVGILEKVLNRTS